MSGGSTISATNAAGTTEAEHRGIPDGERGIVRRLCRENLGRFGRWNALRSQVTTESSMVRA